MDIEDDIYDNITEFSHEEIERVTSLSKSLIEENAALHIQLNKATAQTALLEKSKQVLKRNFACLLETAKAEIDRKDGRIKELQSIVDQRVLRNSHVSSQQIDDIVERRVRQIKRRVRRDGRRINKTDSTSQGHSGDFGDHATQPHAVLAAFDKRISAKYADNRRFNRAPETERYRQGSSGRTRR